MPAFLSFLDPQDLEYPRFYLLLPDLHRRMYLVLAASLGILLQGVTLLHLLGWHTRGTISREGIGRRVFRRWPGLFLINLIGLLLFLGPLLAVGKWLLPGLDNLALSRGITLACYILGFTAEIFLAYAAFLFLSFDSGIKASLRASIVFGCRHMGVVTGLVLIPFFLALPLQWVSGARQMIVYNFRPELIFYLLLTTSFLTVLILYIQLSTLVRYYAEEKLRRPFEGEWDDKHKPEKREYDPAGP